MTRALDHIDKLVGANIRRARMARGLSQEALAGEIGVTFQQVQKYEKGKNAISATRIPALCEALSIQPADVFAGAIDGAKAPLPDLSADAITLAMVADKVPSSVIRAARRLMMAINGATSHDT